nr:DUF1259 domain-containing protein [Streptomyces olivoverticillatus]
MPGDPQHGLEPPPSDPASGPTSGPTRRRLVISTALIPALAGAAQLIARPTAAAVGRNDRPLVLPLPTTQNDWRGVTRTLGRQGEVLAGTVYRVAFLRRDLRVVSKGVTITPDLAVGSYISFVRYADGSTLMMGDMAVLETELQHVTDTLHAHGIGQTALHKHLLTQKPAIWWTHVHGHGHDAVALARGLRAALDRTGTPHTEPPATKAHRLDLDTAGIDAALHAKGIQDGRIYKVIFARRERIIDGSRVLPKGTGSMTALIFQPVGHGRAAINGDFVLVASEVQRVIAALRHGGIDIVSLHSHGLTDSPRLFYIHFWAVDDAVKLARVLHRAVSTTNVSPPPA